MGTIVVIPERRNERLLYGGLLISRIGGVMQALATGWQTYQLTHSPFMVGLVAGLAVLPFAFLLIAGGMLSDRYTKSRIVFVTQSAGMILALLFAALCFAGLITKEMLMMLAFAGGIVNALGTPAQKTLLMEASKQRSGATIGIALFTEILLSSGMMGAVCFGIIWQFTQEVAWIYSINATTFVACVGSLALVRYTTAPYIAHQESLTHSFLSGWQHVWHTEVRYLLVLTSMCTIAGFSSRELLSVMANQVRSDARMLSLLVFSFTIGGYIATRTLSGSLARAVQRIRIRKMLVARALLVLASSQMMMSLTLVSVRDGTLPFWVGVAYLVIGLACIGYSITYTSVIVENMVMAHTPQSLWGRVNSISGMTFIISLFLGTMILSFLSEKLSMSLGLVIFGTISFTVGNKLEAQDRRARRTVGRSTSAIYFLVLKVLIVLGVVLLTLVLAIAFRKTQINT